MKALVLFLSVIILAYTLKEPQRSAMGTQVAADSQFVQEACYMNLGEIYISNIAMMKGSKAIKELGEQVLQDHTLAQQYLTDLVQSLRYSLNIGIDSGYEARASVLKDNKGKDFDSAYLYQLIDGQERAIAAFETQTGTGADRRLVEYAHTQLSLLRQHRMKAEHMKRALLHIRRSAPDNKPYKTTKI